MTHELRYVVRYGWSYCACATWGALAPNREEARRLHDAHVAKVAAEPIPLVTLMKALSFGRNENRRQLNGLRALIPNGKPKVKLPATAIDYTSTGLLLAELVDE